MSNPVKPEGGPPKPTPPASGAAKSSFKPVFKPKIGATPAPPASSSSSSSSGDGSEGRGGRGGRGSRASMRGRGRGGRMNSSQINSLLSTTSAAFVGSSTRFTGTGRGFGGSGAGARAGSAAIAGSRKMIAKGELEKLGSSIQRFDLEGEAGEYPISMPFIPPKEYENNTKGSDAERLLPSDPEKDELFLVQMPTSFPVSKGDGSDSGSAISMENLPSGFLGKLQVYASGQMKLIVGDVVYDVSSGTSGTWYQDAYGIFPNEEPPAAYSFGQINKRMLITPDVQYLLSPPSDFEDETMAQASESS